MLFYCLALKTHRTLSAQDCQWAKSNMVVYQGVKQETRDEAGRSIDDYSKDGGPG